MTNKRLDTITEICVRNEVGFWDVMRVYTKANSKVYAESVKKGENFQLYNPVLEERTMKLVERYYDIERQRQLKRLKN